MAEMRQGLCRFILAAAVIGGPASRPAHAQVPVECGVDAQLTAAAMFNPPIAGPVVYEWRNASDDVVGREETLHLGPMKLPVGSHRFTLTARGGDDRRPTQTIEIVITDTAAPRVRAAFGTIQLPSETVDAAAPPGMTIADACDPAPAITFNPPGPYGPGDTRVTVTARDRSGNAAESVVTFRVPAPPPVAAPPPPAVVPPPVTPAPAPAPAPAPVVEPEAPTPQPEAPPPAPVVAAPVAAPAVVVAPTVPVEDVKGFPWWILAVAALAVAAGSWALKQKKPKLPLSTVMARPRLDTGTQRLRMSGTGFRVVRRGPASKPAATTGGSRGEGA